MEISQDQAVVQMGSDTFTYDANGNQTVRNVGGNSYTLSYDAENRTKNVPHKKHAGDQVTRLVSVSGAVTASFVYDGDGNRVKGTIGTNTITYVGNYLEWKTSTSDMVKYYYAGSTRVAMRTGSSPVNYLLGDHLGSQSITTDSNGSKTAEIRYYAWGTERYTSGTTPTTFQFTGQREESSIGLYFYNARWYDPAAGRFIQADTIITGGTQGLDRYAYVGNNPLRYTDPSGNKPCDGKDSDGYECDQITNNDLSMIMEWLYGWTTDGNFTNKEIETLLDAGEAISKYISSLTGEWGQGWVRHNLGNAVFNQNNVTDFVNNLIGTKAHVFPGHNVNLGEEAFDASDIIHELAHVLDNNKRAAKFFVPSTVIGGGPADKMVNDLGGNPSACVPRLQCWSLPFTPRGYKWYVDNIAGVSPWPLASYGNNGVSDDFAETFRWTIVDQSKVPSGRLAWMTKYLSTIH